MEQVSKEEFDNLVAEDKLIFVDFFADWCGPCQMMLPIIEEIADGYKDNDKVKIIKMDVDQNSEIASRYHIMSVPTYLFIKKNEVLYSVSGAVSKDAIIAKINELE